MVSKVVMPRLSLTMKQGTIGKWYKKEGQSVEKGEPIVEVVSEKATYDLEAPASGTIRKILAEEGVDAPVDAVLALIGAPDETLPEVSFQIEKPEGIDERESRILASPSAKRLAREQNIDLSAVGGSGPEGRISEDDVKKFIEESRGTRPKAKEVIPLSGLRKTSAERVSASFRSAPHSTVVMHVDVLKMMQLHEKLQVSYTAIIVKAAAKALKQHAMINSSLDGDRIILFEDANIGVAVATKKGLIVPVVKKADMKSLKEIDSAIMEMTDNAGKERLAKEDITGGTFTITNLGMFGVDFFTPIINPPEAAILGVGKIAERPVVIDGKIEAKPMMTLSLSYDHRIVDGAPAAEFLAEVKETIEKCSDMQE